MGSGETVGLPEVAAMAASVFRESEGSVSSIVSNRGRLCSCRGSSEAPVDTLRFLDARFDEGVAMLIQGVLDHVHYVTSISIGQCCCHQTIDVKAWYSLAPWHSLEEILGGNVSLVLTTGKLAVSQSSLQSRQSAVCSCDSTA